MDRKIIWVINQTAGKPESGWGERHYYLSKYWIEKGYNIKIISGSFNHLFTNQPKVSNKNFTIEEYEKGITYCWVNTPKYFDGGIRKFYSNIIFMIKLFFLPVRKLGIPSYILVSSMPIFPIINGFIFKKRLKVKKLIIEIRDLWPLTPIYLKGYSKNNLFVKVVGWFEKFAYKESDEIVSLLPNANTYIDLISEKPEKFHWIPNGIETKFLQNEKLALEIVNQIPKNKFIIGYTGTIGMANALEYFIDASIKMKNNTNIHFVLVGDGYLKNQFISKVKENKNITFIDKIKKSQVQNMLSFFDVCYVGRYNIKLYDYGVSYNKYFDYMLASKPILESSNQIKSPAQLANSCSTVKPESSEAIVEGIEYFKNLGVDELNKMGVNGFNYVKKNHNFEYLSDKYLKLF